MGAIVAALRELIGLFVADGSLVLAVLVWIAVCALVLPRLLPPTGWNGAILFLGLAMLLAENTVRASRRKGR